MVFDKPDTSTRKNILDDVNATEKSLSEDVAHLSDWLRKQPHLPQEHCKELLSSVILASKSLERAKERLDKYFSSRIYNPGYLFKWDFDLVIRDKVMPVAFLPKLTPNGERLLMIKTNNIDLEHFYHIGHILKILMMVEIMLRSEEGNSGVIVIYDMEHFDMSFAGQMSITDHAKGTKVLQALPLRMKGMHFIKSNTFMDIVVNTFIKPFLPKKITDRVFVSSDGADYLLQKFHPSILPDDYKGTLGKTYDEIHAENLKTCEKWRSWFANEGMMIVDEAKRPGDQKNAESDFGLSGTFKKLDID